MTETLSSCCPLQNMNRYLQTKTMKIVVVMLMRSVSLYTKHTLTHCSTLTTPKRKQQKSNYSANLDKYLSPICCTIYDWKNAEKAIKDECFRHFTVVPGPTWRVSVPLTAIGWSQLHWWAAPIFLLITHSDRHRSLGSGEPQCPCEQRRCL